MTNLKVHHIGYLVKRIEKAKEKFIELGYMVESDIVYDDIRKIDICFLIKDGYRVELVSPKSDDSVVSGLMSKYKNSPYHICYECDDYDEAYNYLTSNGYVAMGELLDAPAIQGHKVVFLMNSMLGMIELIK